MCCKLDAIDDARLARINRPVRATRAESIIEGIVSLRANWNGKLTLQIMLLPGTGSSAMAFAPAIAHIAPDCVQLNVPSRPVPLRHTLDTRGAHAAFDQERAWRMLDFDEVESASSEIEAITGISIVAPPRESHTR